MALPQIAVPKYNLIIPSTNQEIEYRPYLVGEEKILLIASESEDEAVMLKAVVDIIERCITEDINPKKLKLYDIEYIFTQLKGKSIGESSELIIKCQKCEEQNTITIDAESDIFIDKLKDSTKSELFTLKITDSIGIKMKHLSMEDSLNDTSEDSQTNQIFAKIVQCIDYIFEGDTIYDISEEGTDEMFKFIESLNTKQFKILTDFIEDMPQVLLKTKFKCKSCKKTNNVELAGIENFF
jgi:hypothetical protein